MEKTNYIIGGVTVTVKDQSSHAERTERLRKPLEAFFQNIEKEGKKTMKKTKRRLRPWVKSTLAFFQTVAIAMIILFGMMYTITEAHYQRVEYWNEVAR